jgi:hypothetical protein
MTARPTYGALDEMALRQAQFTRRRVADDFEGAAPGGSLRCRLGRIIRRQGRLFRAWLSGLVFVSHGATCSSGWWAEVCDLPRATRGRCTTSVGVGVIGRRRSYISYISVLIQRPEQPRSRLQPVALHRTQRNAQCARRIFFAVTAEEAAFDYVGQARHFNSQPLHGIVQRDQSLVAVDRQFTEMRQRHV